MRCLSLLVLLLFPLGLAADSLPQLGNATAGFTRQQEHVLGYNWLRNIRGRTASIEDPLIQDYLNSQITTLRQQLDLDSLPVTTLVLNNSQLNAFAVPGNIIGINSGLFLTVPVEEQFLSVLAHELAHLELNHFNQQLDNQAQRQKFAFMSVLTSLVLAPHSIAASQAVLTAGMADNAIQRLAYTRTLESEADRRAMTVMATAGFRSTAVRDMLQTMMGYNLSKRNEAPEYFQTHPLTANRIADSLQWNNHTPYYSDPVIPNSLNFQLIRLRLAALHEVGLIPPTDVDTKIMMAWAEKLREVDQKLLTGQLSAANGLLQSFPPILQTETEWRLRHIEWLRATGDMSSALSQLVGLTLFEPHSIRVHLTLAETLRDADRLPEAIQLLRLLAQQNPQQPRLWFYVMQFSAQSNDDWAKFDAEIQYQWLMGQDERVMKRLESALVSPQWSGTDKARMKDRMNQWLHEKQILESL